MCNNLAIISRSPNFELLRAQFKIGLILGRMNGEKGTGCYHNGIIERSKDYRSQPYRAATHDSLKFIHQAKVWFEEPEDNYNVFMGHNRAPSYGMGSGEEFVHPFEYENEAGDRIIFQHNGTIKNVDEICDKYNLDFKDFKNDSKLLGHLVHSGVDLVELFKLYRGACTCIWYNETTNTLNIFKGASDDVRGDAVAERPLYYYYKDDTYYFNSVEKILHVINDTDETVDVYDFPINTIVSIDENLIWTETEVDRKVPYVPPVKHNTGRNRTIKTTATPTKFRDQRFLRFRIIWYRGRYYYNSRLIHGIKRFGKNGLLDPTGKEYYFYHGYMVKSENVLQTCIENGVVLNNQFLKNAIHAYTVEGSDELRWMLRGSRAKNGVVNDGLFVPHQIIFRNGSVTDAYNNGVYIDYQPAVINIPERKVIIENHSSYFGKDFKSLNEVENHYNNLYGDLYVNTSRSYSIPFLTVAMDHQQTLDDPYLEVYNKVTDNKFVCIHQAQNHYFKANKFTGTEADVSSFYDIIDDYNITDDPYKLLLDTSEEIEDPVKKGIEELLNNSI